MNKIKCLQNVFAVLLTIMIFSFAPLHNKLMRCP